MHFCHLSFPWSRCLFLKAAFFKRLKHFNSSGRLLFPYHCFLCIPPSLCCLNVENIPKARNFTFQWILLCSEDIYVCIAKVLKYSETSKLCRTYQFRGALRLMHLILRQYVTLEMCEIRVCLCIELSPFQAHAHQDGWPPARLHHTRAGPELRKPPGRQRMGAACRCTWVPDVPIQRTLGSLAVLCNTQCSLGKGWWCSLLAFFSDWHGPLQAPSCHLSFLPRSPDVHPGNLSEQVRDSWRWATIWPASLTFFLS